MSVKELIEKLQACRNQDAQIILAVEVPEEWEPSCGAPHSPIEEVVDDDDLVTLTDFSTYQGL